MRPTHIEDYLITVRKGQWFGWSDSKNKVYANLVVHDGGAKPSESDCTNGLKALQDAWDLENDSYKSKRKAEYPSIEDQLIALKSEGDAIIQSKKVKFKRRKSYGDIGDQLDMLYKDMLAGKLDATGEWAKMIKKVKDDNPKS